MIINMLHAILLNLLFAAAPVNAPRHDDDTCLMLLARNLSNPGGNYFAYYTVASREITIKAGDKFIYDVFLYTNNPSPKGGLDIICSDGTPLRDSGAQDTEKLTAHGDAMLHNAVGRWLRREISLEPLVEKKISRFNAQFEGDEKGEYVEFIDNIKIVRADGTSITIYDDGAPKNNKMDFRDGYSERVLCREVPRASVKSGVELDKLIGDKKAKEELFAAKDSLKSEFDLAARFAKAEKRDDIVKDLDGGVATIPSPDEFTGTAAEYHELLHKISGRLDHAHPLMQQYSGRLVGHAHIDLQWLWEWPEGLDFTRSTFEQACKFMDEYPEFTFTQSSAGLYEKIEEQYPELFDNIVKRAKEGRFEFVGGRWCEGDTNMISGESHARHLLYGQRYFKKVFGKISTVGWEPDTFGHTAQMPQILKLGGIDAYYFCRGGKNLPLFWWEGPDGSRVLAFDEPASGSWYNSDITDKNVTELLDFYDKTGLKNLIWVYGVGNHGGGPTREQIEKAMKWKDEKGRPKVAFSTARKFFDLCKEKNLDKLPIVKEELNPVFRGCYTTHGDIKQLNNDAQAALDSAEALAFMASRSGYPYPAADLARCWKTVLWNHHHDTLPGSGIHDSYELTKIHLNQVIEQAAWIQQSAARHLAYRVEDTGEGDGLLVFNPLGWKRDAMVSTVVINKYGKSARIIDASGNVIIPEYNAADFGAAPADPESDTVNLSFLAHDIPAVGYSIYRVKWVEESKPEAANNIIEKQSAYILENEYLKVAIDKTTGDMTSIIDKSASNGPREVLTNGRSGNRIEAFFEEPHGMSAWEIGKIVEVKAPKKAVLNNSNTVIYPRIPVIGAPSVDVARVFEKSVVTQNICLFPGSRQIDCYTTIHWDDSVGTPNAPSPMLRVSFPVGEPPAKDPDATKTKANFEARFSVPFGDIARSADGEDVPALTWASVKGANGGAALLNDHKHGYSVTSDGELRLTLIRASYEPDPKPDQYTQQIHFSLLPMASDATNSEVTRKGLELTHPLVVQPILHNTVNSFAGDRKGAILPATQSFVSFDGLPDAIPTCIKRSEDQNDLIVRFYQDSAEPASGNVIFNIPASEITPVNFLEEPVGEKLQIITPRPGPGGAKAQVKVDLKGYEIKTLRIKF